MKVVSFLMGLGAGAAIALLMAPQSGEETREIISDRARQGRKFAVRRARDIRDMASDRVQDIRDKAADAVSDVKEMARDMADDAVERGKEVVARHVNAVANAVQAGKETYNREAKVS
jgi:gas vesicle protein